MSNREIKESKVRTNNREIKENGVITRNREIKECKVKEIIDRSRRVK